ncbi:beta-ketoacyl synthase chain length factor [Roseateles chitinivorans]|uniref:beta-ketoacyl synthase chain length factor n=1 Tax=Roseateles chitinivorans TaxID=2917965 RepID=UPI003D674CFC
MSSFRVCRWSAWAPGLPDPGLWPAWLMTPDLSRLEGEAVPALSELPPMTRRRIDPLGRAALQTAFWTQGGLATGPVVFSSRWGEISRSVTLLRQLASGEPLSPTAFSLSVHNASSALYSIARGDTANYAAVSAGAGSAAAAVCEALGLLADGARQVLVVSVESALPDPYRAFDAEALPLRAWAALIEPGDEIRLESAPQTATVPSSLPPDLAALQVIAGSASELHQAGWRWSRHV